MKMCPSQSKCLINGGHYGKNVPSGFLPPWPLDLSFQGTLCSGILSEFALQLVSSTRTVMGKISGWKAWMNPPPNPHPCPRPQSPCSVPWPQYLCLTFLFFVRMVLLVDRDGEFRLHTVVAMKSSLSNVFSHYICALLMAEPSGKLVVLCWWLSPPPWASFCVPQPWEAGPAGD